MAKKKAKEETVEQEVELYYNQNITFAENCGVKKVIIYQSGSPNQPPPKPPGT